MKQLNRHDLELTVRTALRKSIDLLEADGKPFEFIKDVITTFLKSQVKDLSDGHNAILGQIPREDFATRGQLQKQFNDFILGINNCRDAILAEIKYRQEKRANEKIKPA